MRELEIEKQFQQETSKRQERARKLIIERYRQNAEKYRNGFLQAFEQALEKFMKNQQADEEKYLKYI